MMSRGNSQTLHFLNRNEDCKGVQQSPQSQKLQVEYATTLLSLKGCLSLENRHELRETL